MSTIDKRVVQLEFDNGKFEQRAKSTLQTLDNLEQGLQFKNASSGLDAVAAKASSFNLNPLTSAAEAVNSRFSAMGTFTSRIIENIADSAYRAGTKIANYIASPVTKAVNQIKTGGWNRAANLEQAKFTMSNLGEEWDDWKEAIDYGVAGTAYGLDQGAMVASKLIASGIRDTEDMKMILKGIAGTASTFSAEYERVADVVQDSVSQGVVMNGELQRLSDMGIPAAEMLAKYLGVTVEEVREMASDRQISGMKLVAALFEEYGESADKANKTFDGALRNLNAGFSKIGEKFATPLRNNMRDLFNTLRVAVNTIKDQIQPIVDVVEDKMNKVFGWLIDMLGGTDEKELKEKWGQFETVFQNVADALENLWKAAESVVKPIAQAFKEVFPPATLDSINDGTKAFADFTKTLAVSKKTQSGIKKTFVAIFTTIKNISGVVKNIFKQIRPMLSTAWNGLKKIYTSICNVVDAIKTGDFSSIAKRASELFSSITGFAAETGNSLLTLLGNIPGFDKLINSLKTLADNIKAPFIPLWNSIRDGFSKIAAYVTGTTEDLDLGGIMSNIGKEIWNLVDSGIASVQELFSGFWDWLVESFDSIVASAPDVKETFLELFGDIPGVSFVVENFEKFVGFVSNLIAQMPSLKEVSDVITSMFSSVVTWLGEKLKPLTKVNFEGLWKDIKDGYSQVVAYITGASETIDIGAIMSKIGNSALAVAGDIADGIGEIFSNIWNWIISLNIDWNAVGTSIGTLVSGIAEKIQEAINKINIDFGGILSAFTNNPVIDAITKFFDTTFTVTKKNTRRAESARSEALQSGTVLKNTTETLADDVEDSFSIFNTIQQALETALGSSSILLFVAAALAIRKVAKAVAGILGSAASAISGVGAVLKSVAAENKAVARSVTATAMIKLAAAIAIIAASIFALTQLPTGKMLTVAGVLLVFMGILAIIITKMKSTSESANSGLKSKILDAIEKFLQKIKAISSIGILIAGIGAGLYLIFKAIQMIQDLDFASAAKGVSGIVGILAILVTTCILLSKFAPKLSKGTAFTILSLAAAIVIMCFAVKQLNKIVSDENGNFSMEGLKKLAASVGAIAVLLIAIGVMAKLANGKKLKVTAKSILLIAAGLFVMSLIVKSLSKVGWEGLLPGLVAVIALIAVFTAATILLAKFKSNAAAELSKLAIGMIAVAAGIFVLGKAFESIIKSLAPIGGYQALQDVAVTFGIFIAAMAAIAKWSGQGTALVLIEIAASMVIFAASVWVMVDAIRAASEIGWEGLVEGIGVFAVALGVLVAIGIVLVATAPAIGTAGATMLPFAASCLFIAAAAWLVVDAIETILTSPAFEGFRKVVGDLANFVEEKIGGMVGGIVDAVTGLGDVRADANRSTIQSYLDTMEKVNAGMIDENNSMVQSLRAMAEDAAKDLGYDTLEGFLGTIEKNEKGVQEAGESYSEAFLDGERKTLKIGSPSKETQQDALWTHLGFSDTISKCMPSMLESGKEWAQNWLSGAASSFLGGDGASLIGSDTISALMGTLSGGGIDMSAAAGQLGTMFNGAFGDSLDLSGVMSGDLSSMMGSISEQMPDISSYMDVIGGDMGQSLLGSWQEQNIGDGMFGSIYESMTSMTGDNQDMFFGAGTDLLSTVGDGFEAGEPLIYDAATNVADTVGNGISDGASSEAFLNAVQAMPTAALDAIHEYDDNFQRAGEMATIGFANGILAQAPLAIQASAAVARESHNSMTSTLGINSPSKVFMQLGKYTVEGFALGLTKYVPIVGAASTGVATTALDGVNSALATIPQAINNSNAFNPVVTPIMDLSNIQNGADSINGMLSDTTLGVGGITGDIISGNLNSLSSLANAFNANKSNNADVVSAISDLNGEINTMANKMTSLQVRMDSGVLVGSISGKMDSALGSIAKRKGRSG